MMIKKVLILAIALAMLCGVVTAHAAVSTSSAVLVNGTPVAFEAYNIDGNNYFKLRDVAYTLNGTSSRFVIGWDAKDEAILLTTGEIYTVVGGEMAAPSGAQAEPLPANPTIVLNGETVSIKAYNIGGNNYFMLRDLGAALGFRVSWDEANDTILIDTGEETVDALSESAVYDKLIAFKEQFPQGMPWGNEQFYGEYKGYRILLFGCTAFAGRLSDGAFGDLPSRFHSDVGAIKVGDTLRINNDTHSVIVLAVDETGVVIAEGNYNWAVNWGRKISTAELRAQPGLTVETRYP